MSKRLSIRIAALTAIVLAGFGLSLLAGGGDDGGSTPVADAHSGSLSRAELDRVLQAGEAASASATRAELAARGQKLFESAVVSKVGESCASCHVLGGAVNSKLGAITHTRNAGQPVSPSNFTGIRDVPALWDVAQTAPYNWVGANKTLHDQVLTAIDTHFLANNPGAADAIVAYLQTLHAPVTRHDQGRLTAMELRGEEIFVGKGGCIACHGGPQFTDNLVHDTDVPQPTSPSIPPDDIDPGAMPGVPQGFNTPQLRDVRNSAPYMHNGVFQTLREVVDFYDTNTITAGPLGLRLTGPEKDELIAYLKTL
jgi:cytochrome c peroxidase